MKKLLAAVLLGTIVFTGCSTAEQAGETATTEESGEVASSGEDVELTLWHGFPTEKAEYLQKMADEYCAQNEGVTITTEFVAASEDILPKVQTALMNDTQPDILWGAPSMTGVLATSGKLVDLTDLISDEWRSDIPEGLWDAGKFEGKTYSVPVEAGTLVLIYNKDMFEEAGIEKVPTTWEELYETATTLTTEDRQGIWLPIDPNNERTTWTWLCFLEQNGYSLLNEDYTELGFDKEGLVETLDYYTSFATEGISPITVGEDAFAEEQVAMIIGTQGAANAYSGDYEMNIGVEMLPGNDELSTGLGTNHYYLFDNGDREEEEALKFMEYMTSGEKNAEWVINAGYLPVSNIAKDSEAFKTFVADKPHFEKAAEVLEYGFSRPSIEEYTQISNTISSAIEAIAYEVMTIEEAADTILAETEAAVSK